MSVWSKLFVGGPLTQEAFREAWEACERRRFETPARMSPRERQIIDAFGGNDIFPPYLYDVMVKHGLLVDAPQWSEEEFLTLWADLRKAMAEVSARKDGVL